jgi:hypothetical protein
LNLFRVSSYRLALKLGIHPVQKLKYNSLNGVFFYHTENKIFNTHQDLFNLDKLKNGYNPFSGSYFSFDNETPNWHQNYYNKRESKFKNFDWWNIPDFDSELGDIKNVWELSRFDWVVQLSAIAVTGNSEAIELLNVRLNSWLNANPPYKGVNWKCGQEASIRLMHLIYASILLNQIKSPTKELIALIEMHLKRIAPTISYAIAQNNNHGTSEAAALFLGGHFLNLHGFKAYHKYERIGRAWLENRSLKLFSENGCFSQYSINYHRFALDTYSFCEVYRKINNLSFFSEKLIKKLQKATQWLEVLTDSETGNAPNIGANDGALLFHVFNLKFRDFRQSVQWANLVFNNRVIYKLTENQKKLYQQLGLNISSKIIYKPINELIIIGDDDGFFIYRKQKILLVFRRPIFNFRPSHSDALHIDLCVDGKNILRDGGSFSYFSKLDKCEYYSGTISHNTILFDNKSQMPSISKFLFGAWLSEKSFSYSKNSLNIEVSSGYLNKYGEFHNRKVTISDECIQIDDNIDGNYKSAKLNWRLSPEIWNHIESPNENIIIIDLKSKIITGSYYKSKCMESLLYNTEEEIENIIVEMKSQKKRCTIINF